MKHFSLFRRVLFLALLCLSWAANAQTHYNMQIGTGTATNGYVPNYTYYNYSYSQTLYTPGEVGIDGDIDTIAFNLSNGGTTRTLLIYMAEVPQTSLATQVAASEFTQVFSGTVSWETGWTVIPLDTVFPYQATGSLVIAVVDETGSYVSSRTFLGTNKSETRSKYIYNDYNAYNTASQMTNSTAFSPNIRIGINSTSTYCAPPTDVAVFDIINDEATISWNGNGSAPSYEVIVSDSVITDFNNANSTLVSDTFYTVNNLTGNALYYVYVRALCDASSSSVWTAATSFRSACVGYTSIPYSTGFEDLSTASIPNCWQQVAVGSSSASTFPAAYVYSTNARTGNVYFEMESSSGETEIIALPAMENINNLMLTFYASCMNTNFVLEAGVMEGASFVPIQTVQLTAGSSNNWAGSYYPYTIYYGSYNGTSERMALRVTASGSYTLMIDDLTVDYLPNCPEPSNFALDSIGVDWAALGWIENGSASSWVIEYDTVDFTPGTSSANQITVQSDNHYFLSGLDSGMTYYLYLRSDCGSDTSIYTSLTFTTLAGAPASVPFFCDFEQAGANGWELINGDQTNHWMVGSAASNGGSRGLYITNDDIVNEYTNTASSMVYAVRNINISVAGEYVYSFDWRNQGESQNYDYIRAFLAPASADFSAGTLPASSVYSFANYNLPASWIDLPSTAGIPGINYTLAQSSTWQTLSGTFTLTAPGAYKFVFVWANDGSVGTNPPAAIDNVQLVRNTCPAPINLTVTGVTANDVSITWQSVGDETSWEVSDGTNSYLANSTTYTLTGLTPDHNYNIRVRAICDVDDTSIAVSTNALTLQSCFRPVAITVDSVIGDSVWVSWTDTANAVSYDLVFGHAGFNPDTVVDNIIMGISANNQMVTGLTLGQLYYFYVRSDCGGEQSSWVGPATATPSYSYIMAATGVDTIHVCGYTIYDDGGENGDYSTGCNSTLVVFPSDPTQTLQISGSGYVENNYDYLYIYDGVGTSGNLLYTGMGTFTMPPINSEDGAVTIVFTSDNMIQYSGFELNVACIPLPDCPHPTHLTVSNIGTNSVELTWDELGSATEWIIQYDDVNFTPGSQQPTANSQLATTNPYTLTGLDSSTTYYVYVASYCNPDTSDYVGISFTTLAAAPSSLPYSCDFEQAGDNGWDLINGSQSNHWMVGIGANNGGNRGLYITQDNTSNGYNTNSTSTVFASRTLILDSAGEYAFSFDWKAEGESSWDYLRVALVPVTVDLVAGSLGSWGTSSLPTGAIALDGGSKLNLSSSWTTQSGTVSLPTSGAYNLVFLWRNDGTAGTQPPAAIDNIMINYNSCPTPTNLVVTRNSSDSICLSWNGNGASGPWLVSYGNNYQLEYNTSAAIGGLVTGTQYTFSVATLCGSDTSFLATIQATPGTWIMRPNEVDTLYMCGGVIYDDGGPNGQYSASQTSTIILRPGTPGNLVSVSGTSYTEGSYDYLRIYDGIGTSGNVLWDDYGVSATQTFGPLESNSGPLTIEFVSDFSVNYDGFTINVSCVSAACRVLNLALNTSVGESGSQLAITWDPVTDAQSYQIEYGNAGFTQGQGQMMSTTTNSATITGLSAMTSYDIYVRSICSGNDTGSWTSITLQTAMCENPVVAYNFDSTQSASTSSYSPIGYSLYDYSYVQTIIPASHLSDIDGEITAMAFNPASNTAGSYFTNMTVWLANIPEDYFVDDDFILPDNNHIFSKVIDSADFSYNSTGWQIHVFDNAFTWDGTSNVLVAVHREHGSWSSGSSFVAHHDTVARTCYAYRDNNPYNPSSVSGGSTSSYVGDIMLISCGGGCPRPGGLYATDVNYNSAVLHWSGSASQYELSVKPAASGTWPAETAVQNSQYAVQNLSAATRYQFRVRAVCNAAEGAISDWVVGSFVTDSLPCFVPTDLHATDLGYITATLAWSAADNQNQWSIRVWTPANGTDFEVTTNPATVTGLVPNTTYNAAIKALCGGGSAESEYSDTIQFTTSSCPQVTGVTVTDIRPTSAVISWNQSNAIKYEIEYGDQNFNQGTGTTVLVESGNSYTLTGLHPDYDYSVFVRAFCVEGIPGAWSDQIDFTTPEHDGINAPLHSTPYTLSIFPNPTSDVTTITITGVSEFLSNTIEVTIVDMNGRTVHGSVLRPAERNDFTTRIDVSTLAKGAYFVRVKGEGINQVKKLIVK